MIPVSRPSIGERELRAVERVFSTGWLGMGSEVDRFEHMLCQFLEAGHAVAVCNGTGALFLALHAAGLGPGDEVLVPSLTYVASVQAITATGAVPVFCDIREEDLNIDLEDAKRRLTPRTRVILPVHFRGVPCDMDGVLDLASENGLRIVEDAAHAFGSFYGERRVGSFGDLTCFSFDPIKVITCGEGGAVVTSDPAIVELMQQKRILGIDRDTLSRYRNSRSWVYDVLTQGYRLHMSNINAAIGIVQLERFDELRESRSRIARAYDRGLSGMRRISLIPADYDRVSLFMYIVRVHEDRDGLMEFMKERGIGTGIHYIPAHTFSFYRRSGFRLPVTERVYEEMLTLPLYSDMTEKETLTVIDALEEWDRGRV
ncbi:MAG: hypothetical protein AVO35_05715 [Candidatus Aegiribacteria sp. MLS_C]|nr:MAG: hypothetical protein AVO35_05715 [Candidatus Aegiribacteria sp. MLS_C]